MPLQVATLFHLSFVRHYQVKEPIPKEESKEILSLLTLGVPSSPFHWNKKIKVWYIFLYASLVHYCLFIVSILV